MISPELWIPKYKYLYPYYGHVQRTWDRSYAQIKTTREKKIIFSLWALKWCNEFGLKSNLKKGYYVESPMDTTKKYLPYSSWFELIYFGIVIVKMFLVLHYNILFLLKTTEFLQTKLHFHLCHPLGIVRKARILLYDPSLL